MKRNRMLALLAAALLLSGCETAYYSAMETVGYAKRDILASRVESARDSQAEARKEITDALTEFGRVVRYDGGELETRYERLASQLEDSERAAERVRSRIADVDSVGEALFREWESELDQYTDAKLRASSAAQLRATRSRYDDMLGAMRRAETKLDPALTPMRDQVLFLKHNLNARAVAGLDAEVAQIDAQVNQLVRELDGIAEADRFIADLGKELIRPYDDGERTMDLQTLAAIVGPEGLITGDDVRKRIVSWVDPSPCLALAIVRPAITEQVSKVLAACHAAGQPVVPMGGLTGLVRGCTAGPGEIGLSLERMHRIESVDTVNRTITVEAGVPLQKVQEEAEKQGLLYPVDFGARGSAHVGGSVATNAGGNSVIRYGMTRDSVLGLEAVLADGTVISAMNRMLKNNAAYDLKQLFIGTEGTLGIVTRLVLRLREMPRSTQTALVACAKFADVTALLKHVDASLGGTLSAFEVMWNEFYRAVTTPPSKGTPPVGQEHPYYVLIEATGADAERDQARFEEVLGQAIESGIVADAAVASSEAQSQAMWELRDNVEVFFRMGMPVAFDVSLPVTEMEGYVGEVIARLEREWPAYRRFVFGHLGDGDLHIVAAGPPSREAKQGIERCVYEPLAARGGSVSAEHGIGLEKQRWLALSRSPAELELMKRIKAALDPQGILNPGRVLPA